MKKLTLLLLIVASAASAQTERETLFGWGPFLFGQTLYEARRSAGNNAKLLREFGCVRLPVDIENNIYQAEACAPGKDGVHVRTIKLKRDAARNMTTIQQCQQAFDDQVAMVSRKYGNADVTTSRDSGGSVTYNFPFKSYVMVFWDFEQERPDRCIAQINFESGINFDRPEKRRF